MPAGVQTWQKGEVLRLRSRHRKTKDKLAIPASGTTIVAKLVKGDGKPLEFPLVREEGSTGAEGWYEAEFAADVTGEWTGDIVATGTFPTKRPLVPFTVRDD